jgi:hypothetical protein
MAGGVRFGRITVLLFLVGIAIAGGLYGPKLLSATAAGTGPLVAIKRKFKELLGYGQFRDKRIKALVKTDIGGKTHK